MPFKKVYLLICVYLKSKANERDSGRETEPAHSLFQRLLQSERGRLRPGASKAFGSPRLVAGSQTL